MREVMANSKSQSLGILSNQSCIFFTIFKQGKVSKRSSAIEIKKLDPKGKGGCRTDGVRDEMSYRDCCSSSGSKNNKEVRLCFRCMIKNLLRYGFVLEAAHPLLGNTPQPGLHAVDQGLQGLSINNHFGFKQDSKLFALKLV